MTIGYGVVLLADVGRVEAIKSLVSIVFHNLFFSTHNAIHYKISMDDTAGSLILHFNPAAYSIT